MEGAVGPAVCVLAPQQGIAAACPKAGGSPGVRAPVRQGRRPATGVRAAGTLAAVPLPSQPVRGARLPWRHKRVGGGGGPGLLRRAAPSPVPERSARGELGVCRSHPSFLPFRQLKGG